jgi:hypothetical protein
MAWDGVFGDAFGNKLASYFRLERSVFSSLQSAPGASYAYSNPYPHTHRGAYPDSRDSAGRNSYSDT